MVGVAPVILLPFLFSGIPTPTFLRIVVPVDISAEYRTIGKRPLNIEMVRIAGTSRAVVYPFVAGLSPESSVNRDTATHDERTMPFRTAPYTRLIGKCCRGVIRSTGDPHLSHYIPGI